MWRLRLSSAPRTSLSDCNSDELYHASDHHAEGSRVQMAALALQHPPLAAAAPLDEHIPGVVYKLRYTPSASIIHCVFFLQLSLHMSMWGLQERGVGKVVKIG